MDSEIEIANNRLKSFIVQLQVEHEILERMVHKNKNQHRRCSYFQYILKVRRYLRLLRSAHLEEILNFCFLVIHGNKPTQKVYLLESLKRKKCVTGKYNFMERLLGVARILSQMVEPMMMAASETSILLARSHFLSFSSMILALIARIRVLVQQILLDVVYVFNMVTLISQKVQSIRLNQEGIEIFRQYYPENKEFVTLECLWMKDKFVVHEKPGNCEVKTHDSIFAGDVSLKEPAIQYKSIEALGGDDEPSLEMTEINNDKNDTLGGSSGERDGMKELCSGGKDGSGVAASPSKTEYPTSGLQAAPSFSNPLKRKTGSKGEVAFISVKKPAVIVPKVFETRKTGSSSIPVKDDPFFDLLTTGTQKDNSLF